MSHLREVPALWIHLNRDYNRVVFNRIILVLCWSPASAA